MQTYTYIRPPPSLSDENTTVASARRCLTERWNTLRSTPPNLHVYSTRTHARERGGEVGGREDFVCPPLTVMCASSCVPPSCCAHTNVQNSRDTGGMDFHGLAKGRLFSYTVHALHMSSKSPLGGRHGHGRAMHNRWGGK